MQQSDMNKKKKGDATKKMAKNPFEPPEQNKNFLNSRFIREKSAYFT